MEVLAESEEYGYLALKTRFESLLQLIRNMLGDAKMIYTELNENGLELYREFEISNCIKMDKKEVAGFLRVFREYYFYPLEECNEKEMGFLCAYSYMLFPMAKDMYAVMLRDVITKRLYVNVYFKKNADATFCLAKIYIYPL